MKNKKLIYIGLGLVQVAIIAAVVHSNSAVKGYLEARREKKIEDTNAASFVIVQYHFKKPQRPHPPGDRNRDESRYDDTILQKKTAEVIGVIISKDGRVLTPERNISPYAIEKIVVEGLDGNQVDAEFANVLTGAPGDIVKIKGDLPAGWKALQFVDAPEKLTEDSELWSLVLRRNVTTKVEEKFDVHRCSAYRLRGNQSDTPDYIDVPNAFSRFVAVLCRPDGRPVGASVYGKIELPDEPVAWRGKDILADEGIDLLAGDKRVKEAFAKYIYEVKITFRPPPKEDEEYSGGFLGYMPSGWSGGGAGAGQERIVYGLAFAPDKLLIPHELARETAAGIDTISVAIRDESVPAKFSGVLEHLQATVISLEEPKLPDVLTMDAGVELPRVKPFWTVRIRELAGKDLVVDYARWITKARGYENKLYRQVAGNVNPGCWLLDEQGRLAGIYTQPRRHYQRIRKYLQGWSGFGGYYGRQYYDGPRSSTYERFSSWDPWSWSGPANMDLHDAAALVEILADLPANYDPHIRHLTKEQQKQRVWLGVEFTKVNKEMAKQLNLREQTQDGRIGLMVNRVYPESPAAKMGLAEGDMLLKISVPEAPWPIELSLSWEGYQQRDWDEQDIPREFERMGYSGPRQRPWPSRANLLTGMLIDIGEGTEAQLTYVHESRELHKDFVIEKSLPDSLSAKKYKDKKIGITVKDLTYEVRAGLNLAKEDEAVVVSKVEPGTPTALARINAFELIRAVDGHQIATVDQFANAIKKAKQQGKESVRMTVEWMGKTRLADLKFEATQPTTPGPMPPFIPGMPPGV